VIDFGTGNDGYKAEWMESVRPRYALDIYWPNHPGNWARIALKKAQLWREDYKEGKHSAAS
jgi:hypothetical protein